MATTDFDVLDELYRQLNVSTVNSTIDGRIYRRTKPLNSELRDIVLRPLVLRTDDGLDVHPGTVMVNCYAKDLNRGFIDETHLEATVDAVIAQIDAYNAGSSYFHVEVENQIIIKDEAQPQMSVASIRLNIIIE